MTARVLVVDDVIQNIKLLEAKLRNEYFDVITAMSGEEALMILETKSLPDIILLDVMMPGMDGFEVCRRIKSNPMTSHIPVIMVTALDQTAKKVEGLEAGADDFLTKPVQDLPLFARVRSLVRLKTLMDELRMRETTGKTLGTSPSSAPISNKIDVDNAKILLVEDYPRVAQRLVRYLADFAEVTVDPAENGIIKVENLHEFDLIMVSLNLNDIDGLRLCSMLRTQEQTRNTPIIIIVEEDESQQMVRAMDMGVTDYLTRPIDKNELLARVKSQIRQTRYAESLRDHMKKNMELAVTDSVTGLYNRHFLDSHLDNLLSVENEDRHAVSLIMMDLDFFKKVNDTYGHTAGDEVLAEFAKRVTRNIRSIDLAVRYGGEEFIVVVPESDASFTRAVAERIRAAVENTAFDVSTNEEPIRVTVSIGIALSADEYTTGGLLMKAADDCLYEAKETGRNKVCGLAS